MPVDRFRAMSYAPNAFDLAKFGAAALMTMGRGGSASADHISGISAGSRTRLRIKRSRSSFRPVRSRWPIDSTWSDQYRPAVDY